MRLLALLLLIVATAALPAEAADIPLLEDGESAHVHLRQGRGRWMARIEVPHGTNALRISVNADRDVDLYLRHGSPFRADFAKEAHRQSVGPAARERIQITGECRQNVAPGIWYVGVVHTGASRAGTTFDLIAFVDMAGDIATVLPGTGVTTVRRAGPALLRFRTFFANGNRALTLDLEGLMHPDWPWALRGPEGRLRRGVAARRIVLRADEDPFGVYTLEVRCSRGRGVPPVARVNVSWDEARGDARVAMFAPILRPGEQTDIELGGPWNASLQRVRLVIPRGLGTFVLEARARGATPPRLFVKRSGPIEAGLADADYVGRVEDGVARLVAGGDGFLPAGTYWLDVAQPPSDLPVPVTLSLTGIARESARPRTFGSAEPPPLPAADWSEVAPGHEGWFALRVPEGTQTLRVATWAAGAPLDLVVVRRADGGILARSFGPRVDEHLTHEFEGGLPLDRELVLGVLPTDPEAPRPAYRLAVALDEPVAPPVDAIWPPLLEESARDTPLMRAVASVVELTSEGQVCGSGVCVDPRGLLIGCRHTLEVPRLTGGEIQREGVLVAFSARVDERPVQAFRARVIADDKDLDLALLEITGDVFGRPLPDEATFPHLDLADGRAPRLGEAIQVLGYPLDGSWRERTPILVTRGTVCGLEREDGAPRWIKIDAWTGSGDSGGAVVDAEHRLVGIAQATLSGAETLGLAIPLTALPEAWRAHFSAD